MSIACVLWCILAVVGIIFSCIPVRAVYDPSILGRCINLDLFIVVVEALNCLEDAVIVLMPLNIVRHLQMPRRHKSSLGLIFVLGGFVIITSVVRIVYTWHP